MPLADYCKAREIVCLARHKEKCSSKCRCIVVAARMILSSGVIPLSTVFKTAFPSVVYHSPIAKKRLLQMPIVVFHIQSETNRLYVMEKVEGLNYSQLTDFINKIIQLPAKETITKDQLNGLLTLAQSDREKECIRYAVFKSSGCTSTKARIRFGFENMRARAAKVERCIDESNEISDAVQELAEIQYQALMDVFGTCTNGNDSSDESDECSRPEDFPTNEHIELISDETLVSILRECEFNWYGFVEKLIDSYGEMSCLSSKLDDFLIRLNGFDLTANQLELVAQSHLAFMASCSTDYQQEKLARAINGEIVTDSESDVNDITDIYKKKLSIQRRAQRCCKKLVTEKRYLSRKISKRTSKIIRDCPDIGETIEKFVEDNNIGADAWRRTGVLTFDGNVKVGKKVTYMRIKKYLEDVYQRSFAYGTVVELCIPRNKRRRSAKRYKGLAKVTTRRARKGFNLKYNPDAHWSSSFYKGLSSIQYVDGTNILNLNRDDATGFRLDTLSTCKQYATPTLQGKEILTTRTDYTNKHPSVIQTTSYNFSHTATTTEKCVGVVKAYPIHKKNPAQHISDLHNLSENPLFIPVFKNPVTKQNKEIDCIRVDGASDEGPNHLTVQYWWTEWHFTQGKIATLVTTRSSGSSYLNRVELQNGCLSLGHANLFIPSTLGGSCIDSKTGVINQEKLKHNLQLAIETYINRVDGCPCGDTTIKLVEGSLSNEFHEISDDLEVFLKGSKKKKDLLKKDKPSLYAHFSLIWSIRNRHMVQDLPQAYVFYLKCCYSPDCEHPICQSGPPTNPLVWYPGGPSLSHLPFPVKDLDRPWGANCNTCKCFCTGHYINKFFDIDDQESLTKIPHPPSVTLKEFSTNQTSVTDDVSNIAKAVLLSIDDTKLWLEHLHTVSHNRQRGTLKAAATRRNRRQEQQTKTASTLCGSCYINFYDNVSSALFWVGCDQCEKWYCSNCESLFEEPSTEYYICKQCKQ